MLHMRNVLVLTAMLMVAACQTSTQTTSGTEYLQRHNLTAPEPSDMSFDAMLRRAANVEPTLTFPARIGLARVEGGSLSAIPEEEAKAWVHVQESLGSTYGEFVPLSPMVAKMAMDGLQTKDSGATRTTINEIRMGAARQHLDAVLVYEVYNKKQRDSNLLSIADLTIIGGYLLPTKSTSVEGYGKAMLIDVMQGYPYGNVDVTVDKEEALSSRWGAGSDSVERDLTKRVNANIAEKLSTQAESMLRKLRAELEAKQKTQQ